MKSIWIGISSFFLLAVSLQGQSDQYTSAGDSDPAAKAILKELNDKYDSYRTLQADFTMEIEFPEQPAEVQKGTISRQGDKYHLDMDMQDIISDGESLYMVLHNNKEVQINDIPDEEEEQGVFSPQSLFRIYESDQFVYVLANEYAQNGKIIQQIEFKPIDDFSDYSKLRMEIDKKKKEVISVKAFGKDGSRYTFVLNKLTPNQSFPAGFFQFKKSDYPDYYVEDLRY